MATKDTKVETPETEDGKALATAGNTALMSNDDFFDGAGEGMEDFGAGDFTVPFISILQQLSKPLQKNHAKYVKGAEAGMFYNSATNAIYEGEEKGLIVVPVHFEHRYVAWKPDNKGIAHDYGSDPTFYDSLTADDKGKRVDAEGNEVIDALQYFVLIIDPESMSMEAAVVSFAKVQAKKGKKWNNLIRAHVEMRNGKPVKPAIYFYAYKMTTTPESNDKGSWYGFSIEDHAKLPDLGDFGSMVFNAAKELRTQVTSGALKAAVEDPTENGGGGASGESGDGDGAF